MKLQELKNDGLIEFSANSVMITEQGKPFVRNVCFPFDLCIKRYKPETKVFCMTI